MPGLFDIAPLIEVVTIRGVPFEVVGIAVEDIPYLVGRFRGLQEIASKGEFTIEKLSEVVPEALPAIFACGLGKSGDAELEKQLRDAKLRLGEQMDLFAAIINVTLPGGVGPFADRLAAIGLVGSPSTSTGSNASKPSRSRKPAPAETSLTN